LFSSLLLLPLIHPTGNRDDEKRKWNHTIAHPIRLPHTKTSSLTQNHTQSVFVHHGTPYYRLQHHRDILDQVATLSVEGLNKSAITRIEHIGWNTVDRWQDKASDCSRRFNDQELTGVKATELQADEIRNDHSQMRATPDVYERGAACRGALDSRTVALAAPTTSSGTIFEAESCRFMFVFVFHCKWNLRLTSTTAMQNEKPARVIVPNKMEVTESGGDTGREVWI